LRLANEEIEGYGAAEEYDETEGERFKTLFYRSIQLPRFSWPSGEAGQWNRDLDSRLRSQNILQHPST